jgi:hypothetical protein
MTDEGERAGEGEHAELETTALEAGIVIAAGVVGPQTLRLEDADIQIQLETAAHQRRVEQQRLDHELNEESLDKAARRQREDKAHAARLRRENITFYAFVGIPIAGLLYGAGLSVWTMDETTKLFAHNLLALIFGGILGGLAGYFTGKSQ